MKKAMHLFMTCALALSLSACVSGTTPEKESPSQSSVSNTASQNTKASDEAITVAFIGNTTGGLAQYGTAVGNATKLFFDQLNASGGINGKKINLITYDDEGDTTKVINAYNLAVQEKATAIVGAVLTNTTEALADATFEDNMPQITGSATAAGVTKINPEDPNSEVRTNVFRSCFTDQYQGERMADYAFEKLGAKRIAILFMTGDSYSEGLHDAFVAKSKEHGVEIVAEEAFGEGDKDFKAQMTNIASKKPDAVYMAIYNDVGGLAIKAAREAGYTGTILGGDGFASISSFASAEELEGVLYYSGYAPGTDSVLQFEKDYETAFGEKVPNMFAPQAFDACMMLAHGIRAAEDAGLTAGTDEYKQAIIDDIKELKDFKGITGTYSFDKFNNPIKTAAIIEIKDGKEVLKEMY